MAKRLLSYSPEQGDEAAEICELLQTAGISFYETPASRFGFSSAAIWVTQDSDLARAKALLTEHEDVYAQQARARYQAETGYDPTAPLNDKLRFYIRHLYTKRKLLPFVIIGFALVVWYFYLFFDVFF